MSASSEFDLNQRDDTADERPSKRPGVLARDGEATPADDLSPARIDETLRRIFQDVRSEPVPEHLAERFRRLSES